MVKVRMKKSDADTAFIIQALTDIIGGIPAVDWSDSCTATYSSDYGSIRISWNFDDDKATIVAIERD